MTGKTDLHGAPRRRFASKSNCGQAAQLHYLAVAVRAARAAATVIRRHRSGSLAVDCKSNRADLVTQADREAERRIRAVIGRAFPRHGVLAEESGASAGDGRHRWLIDPIDGTINYVAGFYYYCTSIALEIGGRTEVGVIYDPERRELFWARRGHGAYADGRRLRVTTLGSPGSGTTLGSPGSGTTLGSPGSGTT
ncbi:MAG: hypothetical protein JXR83_04935, partial [Deltaproteobacteria bacterium]|nr:hypothetical protein [Deltaproteobacteria bacterium]